MLIEDVELTLSHVDLGTLSEFATMALFGNAISHRLTRSRGISTRQILDAEGRTLYPAYYMTHLQVPPGRLLEQFQVWDTVSVGVETRSFGGMIVDSSYALGRKGELAPDATAWDPKALPTMRSGTLFVIEDRRTESQPAVPRADLVAEMPRLTQAPESAGRFKKIQGQGTLVPDFDGPLRPASPILYPVVQGRDVMSGHAVMFATFTRILEDIERILLTEHLWPAFPATLLDRRCLLERETYYLSNSYADSVIRADIAGKITPCPPELAMKVGPDLVPAALLTFVIELYQQARGTLLIASRVTKLIAIPAGNQAALRDAERILFRLAKERAHSASPGKDRP